MYINVYISTRNEKCVALLYSNPATFRSRTHFAYMYTFIRKYFIWFNVMDFVFFNFIVWTEFHLGHRNILNSCLF